MEGSNNKSRKKGLERYSEMIWRPFFENEFKDIIGKKVVDMGCRDGRYTASLIQQNEYYRVDTNPKACVVNLLSSVEDIPLVDGTIDEVIALGILDYSNPRKTLKEASRLLRIGGRLRLMVPNTICPYHMLASLFNFRYHKKTYVWYEIQHLVVGCGFEIDFVYEDGFCFWTPTKWLQESLIPLYLWFNRIFGGVMGNNIYVRAVKI